MEPPKIFSAIKVVQSTFFPLHNGRNVGIAIININKAPNFDGLYHPFMVMTGAWFMALLYQHDSTSSLTSGWVGSAWSDNQILLSGLGFLAGPTSRTNSCQLRGTCHEGGMVSAFSQWPFQEPIDWRYLYIRPIFQAYVREYPPQIWPYMVHYLHFRILKFPYHP